MSSTDKKIDELSVVTLATPIDVDGRTLPARSKGTVAAAYKDGLAFEVEFFEPFHCVVTVERDALT